MAGTVVTIVGNLTADPELRQASGLPVVSFTVAQTERRPVKDRPGTYEDGTTTYLRCSVWRDYAVNVAESLVKGDRVIVTGTLRQDSYEKDGVRRTTYEVAVEEVGAVLRFAQVKVRRAAPVASIGQGRRAAPATADAPF